jgi:penicillin-binding protein-related factor A (putative recombinase)
MSEKSLWQTIRREMGHMGHLVRVENTVERGTPDVNGCIMGIEFWLELKEMPKWTRGNFLIPHYTLHQRHWLRARGLARGRAFLFLRVVRPSPVYLLFDWQYAFHHVGKVPREELENNAALKFGPEFDADGLLLRIGCF